MSVKGTKFLLVLDGRVLLKNPAKIVDNGAHDDRTKLRMLARLCAWWATRLSALRPVVDHWD
jgi:hypothetical protein